MICTSILSLFIGCAEPVKIRQAHKTERTHVGKTHRRKHTKESKRGKAKSNRCGQASYYGRELAGRRTANGERFKPSGLTAASWHHGFGQRVTVINQKNGRTVTVRINDRGPAGWTGRIIDLSEGAFRKLADTRQGIIKVCLG